MLRDLNAHSLKLARRLLSMLIMRIPRKYTLPESANIHMMWRAHNREPIMSSNSEKLAYLTAVFEDYQKNCSRQDFVRYAYTVMSNHAHHEDRLIGAHAPYSEHMRRANSRFGYGYNRRHDRLGKVAHDRPKTKVIEDDCHQQRVMLYLACNPVRAGQVKHPADISYRLFSSCRFYSQGEKNRYTDMLTPPDWYLRLGKTSKTRQARFRSILDKYLVEQGLKQDPLMFKGLYLGSDSWVATMRRQLSEAIRRDAKATPAETDSS